MATRCPAKEKETKNYLISPVVLQFCKQLTAVANSTSINLKEKPKQDRNSCLVSQIFELGVKKKVPNL